jgi:hypothetical protein
LEAFSNEISSLTSAFIFSVKRDFKDQYLPPEMLDSEIGIPWAICHVIANLKENKRGSFYDRYSGLLKVMQIEKPDILQELYHLRDLRNALVHFRLCDVPIVRGKDNLIRYAQEPPEVFTHLKSYEIEKGWPVVAAGTEDGSVEWILRISTYSMGIWSLQLVLDAITYLLDCLPAGSYKDFILQAYMASDRSFKNIFEKGKQDVKELRSQLFSKMQSKVD